MYPRPIERLMRHFQRLPGIGPKQAARFAFRVLAMNDDEVDFFAQDLKNIKARTARCEQCRLTFESDPANTDRGGLCPICKNPNRNQNLVCVVETERDAYTIEHSNTFSGVYHVLGHRVSLRGEIPPPAAAKTLVERFKSLPEAAEAVLALSATTEGQATALWLKETLSPLGRKVTHLGRGLSSGIEIEYADRDTLSDAFLNRK
jgi:recombination protein RecR